MLIQPLMDKLDHLRLYGLRAALADQLVSAQYADLSFEDRLGLLVDAEWTARTNANFKRRLKAAHLHQEASIEDLDMAAARGLDRAQMLSLAAGDWIARSLGVIVLGPTGSGKTFVACALGHAACRLDHTVRYERLGRLLFAVSLAHADGSYARLLDQLRRVDLLICQGPGNGPQLGSGQRTTLRGRAARGWWVADRVGSTDHSNGQSGRRAVRKERPSSTRMWLWCRRRSMAAVARRASPKRGYHSVMSRLEVMRVELPS